MADTGVIFKRCGCRNDVNRDLNGRVLGSPSVGMAPGTSLLRHDLLGRPERARRCGYPSQVVGPSRPADAQPMALYKP